MLEELLLSPHHNSLLPVHFPTCWVFPFIPEPWKQLSLQPPHWGKEALCFPTLSPIHVSVFPP